MKITIKHNGVTVNKEIPVRWDDVKFSEYVALYPDDGNLTKRLTVFTGVEEAVIRRSQIKGLQEIAHVLSFLDKPIPYQVPKTLLGYPLPKNIEFESTGQFEDVKAILETFPRAEKEGDAPPIPSKEDLKKYCDVCAVYCMKNYVDSSIPEKEEFAKKFLDAPVVEVLAVGNFTQLRLIEWNLLTKSNYRLTNLPRRSWMLAMRVWLKRLAFSVRWWRWKRKLASQGMTF